VYCARAASSAQTETDRRNERRSSSGGTAATKRSHRRRPCLLASRAARARTNGSVKRRVLAFARRIRISPFRRILAASSNGEVEGPGTQAGEATRAHNLFRRPRRPTASASRTPPTIVRGAGVAIERRHLSSLALPHRATARSSEAKRKVRHNDPTEAECSR